MSNLLLRTKNAIQDCEIHLTATQMYGTEIEAYLTQYLLVIMVAEVQQEVYRLAEERASFVNDPALSSFVAAASKKVFRSALKSEIAGFVGMFSIDCKTKLDGQLQESDITIYNNAVSFRHDIAHKQGSQISFRELKDAVVVAEKVLDAMAFSLK